MIFVHHFSSSLSKNLFYSSSFTLPFVSPQYFLFFLFYFLIFQKPIRSGQKFSNSLEKFSIPHLLFKPVYFNFFFNETNMKKIDKNQEKIGVEDDHFCLIEEFCFAVFLFEGRD